MFKIILSRFGPPDGYTVKEHEEEDVVEVMALAREHVTNLEHNTSKKAVIIHPDGMKITYEMAG